MGLSKHENNLCIAIYQWIAFRVARAKISSCIIVSKMMEYCRCISVTFLFLLLSLCIVDKTTGKNETTFEEFSKMHANWLQIISNPDIDLMLRENLFSYGLTESTNTTLVRAYIQKLKHSTDPMLNLNSPLLPSRIKCTIDILYTVENLKKEWALQMLDSAGKIPSGILKGNVLWTGNYRECLEIYAPPESVLNISFGNFRGQYCIASWTINISSGGYPPIPIKSSLCVPDTCNASTIEEDIRFLPSFLDMPPYGEKYTSILNLNSFTCRPRSIPLDRPAISLLILLGVLGIIILLGSLITVVEFYMLSTKEKQYIKLEYDTKETSVEEDTFEEPQNTSCEVHLTAIGKRDNANDEKITLYESRKHKMSVQKHSIFLIPNSCIGIFCWIKRILKCFCVFTNGSKIFNTSSSQQQFLCIHGIRFLSMMWVIATHSGLLLVRDLDNIVDFTHAGEYWPSQFASQGSFAVDSFFLMSGFLMTYLFLVNAKSSERKMNWLYFYIYRYWRITPVYLLVLGFNIAIYRYLGSGPFWDDEATESAICRKNWWWNLLYINNFLDYSEMCAKWSWYLAADMQFYVISPLFLYFLCRWPKIGLSVISGLLGLSWIITGWISAKYEVLPFFFSVQKDVNPVEYIKLLFDSADVIYFKPYCRIGPYLIGAILAFLVLKAGDNKNFLKIWQQVLGWCSAAFFSLSVIFGLYHVEMNRTLFDFYNALSRSLFSLCPAWVIFACLTGHGGFVNKILSLKLWIPLSRLTYCAYIVHSLVLTYYYQTLQIPIHFTPITMMIYYLASLIWSYGFAFILSAAFESPMMNLEKLIVKRNS